MCEEDCIEKVKAVAAQLQQRNSIFRGANSNVLSNIINCDHIWQRMLQQSRTQ
jgi:hypothetical protein